METVFATAAVGISHATGCSVFARSCAVATLLLLLGALAVMHAAWAAGVTWPARDRARLATYVIGSQRLPGRGACLAVAAALAAFAWLFLAEASRGSWRGRGQLAVAAIFAARGVLGFGYEYARPAIRGTPFATYNRWFYSPLCLLIAALAACRVA